MRVTKRDGSVEMLERQKICNRLQALQPSVNVNMVVDTVMSGLYDMVSTLDIDEQLAQCAFNLAIMDRCYGRLAADLQRSNLEKSVPHTFAEYLAVAVQNYLLDADFVAMCHECTPHIERIIDSAPRSNTSYFGLKTLCNGYLLQERDSPRRVIERLDFMFMRVAMQLFGPDMGLVNEMYVSLSQNYVTVASPILFSAGADSSSRQMASCFVLQVPEDSVQGMYTYLRDQAVLMKSLGGIGVPVSNIRFRGAPVFSFNGHAAGVPAFLRVINASCDHISQGGGKRVGALAAYLEPWHPDIVDFLRMKRVDGSEDSKARSLFYGLWIPDEFMRRVSAGEQWTVMCPHRCPGLSDAYGTEFDGLYRDYEARGLGERSMSARELFVEIVKSMIETGNPYVMFKDHVNRKSNHRNIGPIRSSNLCSEICLHFDEKETAVCVLGSVVLNKFVRQSSVFESAAAATALAHVIEQVQQHVLENSGVARLDSIDDDQLPNIGDVFATELGGTAVYFDFALLRRKVELMVYALDMVIDKTAYPLESCRHSNNNNRPIGIGVQGLADAFLLLRLPFDSCEARLLNRLIFEHIYFAAYTASCRLSKERGPYPRFDGSPMSRGELQPHMWNARCLTRNTLDWKVLVAKILEHGIRNSVLTAVMPTATTAQIWGNNESIEPYTSNLYHRRVSSGQFLVANPHLMQDLVRLGCWMDALPSIVKKQGSVQHLDCVPAHLKALYKTSWEIKQRVLVDLAIDRAPFVDQSQSLNVWMEDATMEKLSALLTYAWRNGLKTATYYVRTKPAFHASMPVLMPCAKGNVTPPAVPCVDDDACISCTA